MGMLKIWFWRQNAKIHFSQRNGKTPLQFFFFILIVCYRCLTKAKKIWKKSCRLRRRPLYVDLALLGFFGTFAFFLAKIRVSTHQELCFHPYRPWVGSETSKNVTETKYSKFDKKVPNKSCWRCASKLPPYHWLIKKKSKSETLHPKRLPFYSELPPSGWCYFTSSKGGEGGTHPHEKVKKNLKTWNCKKKYIYMI